ncbi:MAG TPA: SBBP repeat-containing protein [Chitinophagaceae bacterium]|nr:SBBP repeat-containing protein [Chitinophagaceae bacterium]
MKPILYAAIFFTGLAISSISYSQVNQDWVRKFVGSGADNAAGIAADNSGNIYICGNNNWGSGTSDMYMIRYNSAGTQTAGFLYNSPYNYSDDARAIVTDPAGNVYVAGKAGVNSSTSDIVIIKYNSSAVQQWVTIYNSPENYIDDATAMAVDAAGNVYLTGYIVKGSFEYDYQTLKFNNLGKFQWAARYNGTANGVDIASDITVDATGNVYVTGLSAGQFYRWTTVIPTGYDYLTIKYSPDGTERWVQRYNFSNKNDEAKSLALDASGNVYITGSSATGSANQLDCATIKYNPDGAFLWVQRFAGVAGTHDAGKSIAVDGSGNAYVAGYSYTSSGVGDVLAIKYIPSGAAQWIAFYDAGSGAHDIANAMALDGNGNMYIAAQTNIPGVTNSDYLTIKYTSSGVRAWVARYNGPENQSDYATALVVVTPNSGPVGGNQNPVIYVTGSSNNDVVTIKYSQPTVIGPAANLEAISAVDDIVGKFNVSSYPNPVRYVVNIVYELPVGGKVSIIIYDAFGRKVASVVEGYRQSGRHVTRFNAAELPSGVYNYQLIARSGKKEFRETKMIVVGK